MLDRYVNPGGDSLGDVGGSMLNETFDLQITLLLANAENFGTIKQTYLVH